MVEDRDGVPYPFVDTSACVDCGLCEKVCPIINVRPTTLPEDILTYAAINRREDVRLSSSSGGVFQAFAEYTINSGGVVFGATFDRNWEVVHDKACALDEIEPLKRSKYVQSDTRNTFAEAKDLLLQGKCVTYVGTPCQIAGLKQFLRKDYDNLITISVICHGVPSRGVWRKYLTEIKSERSEAFGKNTVLPSLKFIPEITGINFREKQNGGYVWQKFGFVVKHKSPFEGDQNSVLWSSYVWEEPYMLSFLRDYISRPSCFDCKFRNGSSHSDIIIGDFWGIEKVCEKGDFTSDKGTTWILATNQKGADFVNGIEIIKRQFSLKEGRWANTALIRNPRRPLSHHIYLILCRRYSVAKTLAITEKFYSVEQGTMNILRKIKKLLNV